MTDATETTAPQLTEPETPAQIHIFEALAAAQAEFLQVKKNGKANYGNYATLDEILNATRPALNKHGLYLFQRVEAAPGGLTVETVIGFKTGQTLSSGKLFMPTSTVKGGNAAQAMGSARTYACRYSLSSFLGIAADDDDDGKNAGVEGNFSNTPPQRQQPQPRQEKRQQQRTPKKAQEQSQPQGVILTQEKVDEGHLAAEGGVECYRAFFFAQTREIRNLLDKSGWHAVLKDEAQKADMETAKGGQTA